MTTIVTFVVVVAAIAVIGCAFGLGFMLGLRANWDASEEEP